MSIQAVAWVLDHSESRGVDRLVLISLANHANQDGMCWPAQRTVAKEAGIGNGTVANAVSRLVELGEIEVVENGTARRSTRYRFAHLVSAASNPVMSAASTSEVSRTIKNHQEPFYAQEMSKEEQVGYRTAARDGLKKARRALTVRSVS